MKIIWQCTTIEKNDSPVYFFIPAKVTSEIFEKNSYEINFRN